MTRDGALRATASRRGCGRRTSCGSDRLPRSVSPSPIVHHLLRQSTCSLSLRQLGSVNPLLSPSLTQFFPHSVRTSVSLSISHSFTQSSHTCPSFIQLTPNGVPVSFNPSPSRFSIQSTFLQTMCIKDRTEACFPAIRITVFAFLSISYLVSPPFTIGYHSVAVRARRHRQIEPSRHSPISPSPSPSNR